MSKTFLKSAVGWGIGLWFIGYVLGFVLYAAVPPAQIGWYIMPVGVIVTLWVLLRRVQGTSMGYYLGLGIVWALIAIAADWLFIVKALHPADGYYKLDVYLYYALTFMLPVVVGLFKKRT
jgi:hypothetical protein